MRLNIASMAILCATLVRRGGRAWAFVPSRSRPAGNAAAAAFASFSKTVVVDDGDDAPTQLSHRRRRPRHDSLSLYAALHPREFEQYEKDRRAFFKLDATVDDATTAITESSSTMDGLFPLKGKSVDDVPPRMRFAPSPTGSLHVGGARTALYNWLLARKGDLDYPDQSSAFVVRVEDTDQARSTKESEESVLADLHWLGLVWDEGPDSSSAAASYGPYRQSERGDLYKRVADVLIEQGKAYPCFCTQEELATMKERQEAAGEVTRYDNTWRDADPEVVQRMLDEGREHTVRFRVPPGSRVVIDDAVRGRVAWDAESTVGDFILLRSSGVPVYNFCVAVDDATMGITTVVRAEEHLTNTLRQGLLLDAIGAPRPRYAHCSLILGEDKQKLSKRHGATSCNQFRLDGYLPDAMINYLSLLGWNDGTDNEIFTRDELIDSFELDRVVKSPSVFDMEKLNWVNSQHLKMLSVEEVTPLVQEQLNLLGMIAPDHRGTDAEEAFAFASTCLAKQMMETTKRAATNAAEVLDYTLPASFANMESAEDDDTKDAHRMIRNGHFFRVASRFVESYDANELPRPDPSNILDAFVDPKQPGKNAAIVEDNQQGGGAYSYPAAYKVFMKTLAKELKIKGKDVFHPARYALTGVMSGQDVTKQMSLVSMVEDTGVVDASTVTVVGLDERVRRLRAFLETIPDEFRRPPPKKDPAAKAKAEAAKAATDVADAGSASVVDLRANYDGPPVTALDVRVGVITRAWEHPESDKLWCEEIDLGEDEPRQVASGLRRFYQNASDLEGRRVLVVANLKARKLAGFPSHGMVLCASNEAHDEVHVISAPADAAIGERVRVPGWDFEGEEGKPFAENKVGKKKIFEKLAPHLKTDEYGTPGFLGAPFVTSGGVCSSPLGGGQVA